MDYPNDSGRPSSAATQQNIFSRAELKQHLQDADHIDRIREEADRLATELSRPEQFISLTDEQQRAVDAAVRRATSAPQADPKEILITGPAGSGKTALTRALASILQNKGLDVMGMAFTHAAVQRLYEVSGLECFTTASALCIKPKRENGKTVFRPDPYGEDRIDQADVWIVDECSMFPTEQHNILLSKAGGDQLIVYVGDSEQLTPIVKTESK